MRRVLISIILLSTISLTPALAQTSGIDLRVGKLEKEMRAVQRKIFPNGTAIQPEISAAQTPATTGAPSSAPITDLTARVDALESQIKTLTGQVEIDSNRLKKIEDAFRVLQGDHDTRLKALEGTGEATAKPTVATPTATKIAVSTKPDPATKPAFSAKPDPARKSAIAAIEIPATGDAAEDAYTYGFRLWSAKLYPEAQVKLKEFAAKYPKHKRASYAQNLLGRAYLDEGKPALASVAFYENYTKNAKGERASESLYFLGVALTRLKKLPDACKVYSEFDDVYSTTSGADLKAKVAKGRADAKCST
jgi:TolA-binding protein